MKSNRPLLIALAAVLLAAIVFAYLYWSAIRSRQVESEKAEKALVVPAAIEEVEAEEKPIELLVYQSTPRNPGRPVERKVAVVLAASTDQNSKALQVVSAALQEMGGGITTSSVEQVYLLGDGTVVVDFSRDVVSEIKGGASLEYALLLTLSRSLINNLEGVRQVRFLVGGLEQPTLAGHVSLATPFR